MKTALLAVTLHETLWFKRSAWVSDFATVICQLTFEVRDGGYTATLRNIRYHYDALSDANHDNLLKAEDWITDKEALTKNGTKLTRIGGKKAPCEDHRSQELTFYRRSHRMRCRTDSCKIISI